jgi:hypothetical protein
MTPLIRFKLVVIESNITFNGRTKKTLKYPVRSVVLVPRTHPALDLPGIESLPEIFLH